MLNYILPKIVPFMRNMEKYGTAGQATDDSIIQRMRIECWTTSATDTHSEYVILPALSRKQWKSERTSILRFYVYCLVYLSISNSVTAVSFLHIYIVSVILVTHQALLIYPMEQSPS